MSCCATASQFSSILIKQLDIFIFILFGWLFAYIWGSRYLPRYTLVPTGKNKLGSHIYLSALSRLCDRFIPASFSFIVRVVPHQLHEITLSFAFFLANSSRILSDLLFVFFCFVSKWTWLLIYWTNRRRGNVFVFFSWKKSAWVFSCHANISSIFLGKINCKFCYMKKFVERLIREKALVALFDVSM